MCKSSLKATLCYQLFCSNKVSYNSRGMRLPRESFRKHHGLFLRNAIQMVLLKQITHETFMLSGRYSLIEQRELWVVPLLKIAFSVGKDAVHLCIFLLIQFLSNPGQRWQKCVHIPIPSHLKNFLKGKFKTCVR